MPIPAELTDPHLIVYFVGVTIQLAAAGWLFYLAPGDSRHRSFAVLVTCNALWDILEGLYHGVPAPRSDYYLRVYAYLAVWTVAALVWFLSVYPSPRRHATAIAWSSLGFAAVLSLWLAAESKVSETAAFGLVWLGWTPLLTLGAALILRKARRRRGDPRAWSMLLVVAALLVYPLSNAITLAQPSYWILLKEDLGDLGHLDGWLLAIVELAYLVSRILALALVVALVRIASLRPADGTRCAVFLGILMGVIVLVRVLEQFGPVLPGENALVFGILVAYALARGRLFDADLKLKLTISRGTIAGAFGFVFFVVSELAENWLEDLNYAIGLVACALLFFANKPLKRWANAVADRLMPGVKDTPQYTQRRKQDVFRMALAAAFDDGRVTPKERRMLAALAQRLGIEERVRDDLEDQARRQAAE